MFDVRDTSEDQYYKEYSYYVPGIKEAYDRGKKLGWDFDQPTSVEDLYWKNMHGVIPNYTEVVSAFTDYEKRVRDASRWAGLATGGSTQVRGGVITAPSIEGWREAKTKVQWARDTSQKVQDQIQTLINYGVLGSDAKDKLESALNKQESNVGYYYSDVYNTDTRYIPVNDLFKIVKDGVKDNVNVPKEIKDFLDDVSKTDYIPYYIQDQSKREEFEKIITDLNKSVSSYIVPQALTAYQLPNLGKETEIARAKRADTVMLKSQYGLDDSVSGQPNSATGSPYYRREVDGQVIQRDSVNPLVAQRSAVKSRSYIPSKSVTPSVVT